MRVSENYEGRRMIVDGLLIDSHAFEYGDEPEEVADSYHAADATDIEAENVKLRELCGDIYGEYRYLRVRFHRIYVHHEERMRAIEQRMCELGVEVDE